MKKLLYISILWAFAQSVSAQQTVTITASAVWQDCDKVCCSFTFTDSSVNEDGIVYFQVRDPLTDSIIAAAILFYDPPMINYSDTMYAMLFNQPFGSHTQLLWAYNTSGDADSTNTKDLDLATCYAGIQETELQWCTATLTGEQLNITLQNEVATLVSVIDMNGKIISTAKIYNTTVLPFIVPSGIYCVLIEQSGQRKAFKFAKQQQY